MKHNDWTEQMRERLANAEAPVPENLWEGIERRLDARVADECPVPCTAGRTGRKGRTAVLRWAAAASVALLAGSALWWQLLDGGTPVPEAPSRTAHAPAAVKRAAGAGSQSAVAENLPAVALAGEQRGRVSVRPSAAVAPAAAAAPALPGDVPSYTAAARPASTAASSSDASAAPMKMRQAHHVPVRGAGRWVWERPAAWAAVPRRAPSSWKTRLPPCPATETGPTTCGTP